MKKVAAEAGLRLHRGAPPHLCFEAIIRLICACLSNRCENGIQRSLLRHISGVSLMTVSSTNDQAQLVRLHIGCAEVRLAGYINIDARETKAVDVVADGWNLQRFSDESVSEIYCRHMIEHLSPSLSKTMLLEWRRVLVAGGVAHIVCPDIIFHAKQLLGLAHNGTRGLQITHALFGLYGFQLAERGGSEYDAHKWGYTFDTLSRLCQECGFSMVEKVTEGRDLEPWHLNIKAYKSK